MTDLYLTDLYLGMMEKYNQVLSAPKWLEIEAVYLTSSPSPLFYPSPQLSLSFPNDITCSLAAWRAWNLASGSSARAMAVGRSRFQSSKQAV